MAEVINVEVNPKDVYQVKQEKIVKRLEWLSEKCEKIDKIMIGLIAIGGVAALGLPATVPALFAGWENVARCCLGTAMAGIVPSLTGMVGRLITPTNVLKDKLKDARLKAYPRTRLKKIVEREQNKMGVFEGVKKGIFPSEDALYGAGLDDSITLGTLRSKASQEFSLQKQKVSVLEMVQDFAEKSNDRLKIYEMVVLAEDLTGENIEKLQKMVSKEQVTENESTSDKGKSPYGYDKRYGGYEK